MWLEAKMKKLKKIAQEELDEILRLHELCFDSQGEGGKQADLRRTNLKGLDLTTARFTLADFIGVDLYLSSIRGVCFFLREIRYGLDLRGADLTGADISHLTKQEFLSSVFIDKTTVLTDVKFKEE